MPSRVPVRARDGAEAKATRPVPSALVKLGDSYRSLREVVAEQLRTMILNGELAPGERLFEDKLAELLGVSRNPVREAIRSLEATGLVEVVPRRGAYVCRPDLEDLRQQLEIRGVLEGHAAAVAATSGDTDLVARLTACLEEGSASANAGNNLRSAELHTQFHKAIEDATGNPFLAQVIEPIRQRTELVFSLLLDDRRESGWEEHFAIRDAIASGDADAARDAVYRHIVSVIDDLRRHTTPVA
jgi:DNA-binding GntR family transcriptional regulator